MVLIWSIRFLYQEFDVLIFFSQCDGVAVCGTVQNTTLGDLPRFELTTKKNQIQHDLLKKSNRKKEIYEYKRNRPTE